jgi:hypothetical protein
MGDDYDEGDRYVYSYIFIVMLTHGPEERTMRENLRNPSKSLLKEKKKL